MKSLAVPFFTLLLATAAVALEPWADKNLPVRDGLALWLDAARVQQARAARGLPEAGADAPIDSWPDGSGQGRDARQPTTAAQPRLAPHFPVNAMRFDGAKTFFAATAEGWSPREATVLVVAAPLSNAGGFRALAAAHAAGRNDYVSGFNLDLGSAASLGKINFVNAEGAGFGKQTNLLAGAPLDFGAVHRFALVIGSGASGVRLFVDGVARGSRDRAADSPALRFDAFTIGARMVGHGEPPKAQGFLEGEIFEVLAYDHALAAEEVQALDRYFAAKYTSVQPIKKAAVAGGVPLETVKDAPPVQVLSPGFAVRRLPVQLTNVNFVRYAADGSLFAAGYDGRVWRLHDTDGDGVEDKAELFWEDPKLKFIGGLALTPPGYPRGQGVFLATRGRIALIVDKDGDGRGDEDITVATGWTAQERSSGGGASDALGLALDREGNVFFGLGTHDFTNAYLLDAKSGTARYRASGERGTIQRVSSDFARRETVCSGVRFSVGLAFNAAGDLFATDQEGATWLPNGNPFDELLQIQRGRHYGFPPQHPRNLPEVVDEPSVFDYGPQHQSACGLFFDEPVNGGPIFGPAWWRGAALVAGESRGKIYRTHLAQTPAGYVARTEIVAAFTGALPIDPCVSPRGDLVVTCHSGKPDWGTGVSGFGEIYKITRLEPATPQPALAWRESATELRVAFDAPLRADAIERIAGKVRLTQGEFVRAGDRFEMFRPGYQAVQDQLAAPRFPVPVSGTRWRDDARTLIITTPPRPQAAPTSISIEANLDGVPGSPFAGQLDVCADASGVEAQWVATDGAEKWSGWLPHPDLGVARTFTTASAAHERWWTQLDAIAGTLSLRGQLDLGEMLQPAVQPAAKLDWERPAEEVTVVFTAARAFALNAGGKDIAVAAEGPLHHASVTQTTHKGTWLPFALTLFAGTGDARLTAHWFTSRDERPRAFPLRRVLPPYAEPLTVGGPIFAEARDLPELKGGNWLRGKKLFFTDAACAVCHSIRGEGNHVGPDLTNLIFRDYSSVLRDIRDPSAAINPEHTAYLATMRDGSAITGVLVRETPEKIWLCEVSGQTRELERAQVADFQPLAISLMPPGLDVALGPERLRDLMTFLLQPPLEPAPLMLPGAPSPRKQREVDAILASVARPSAGATPLRILLCASEKDAGHNVPGMHDYPLWRERWSRLLGFAEGLVVETADTWPAAAQWLRNDVVVFNSYNPAWARENDAAKVEKLGADLDAFLARGGGLVFLHFSMNAGPHTDALASRIGLAWRGGVSKFRHGASDWMLDHTHPLAIGFEDWKIPDECYWNLAGDLAAAHAHVLATSLEDAAPRPQMWTREMGPGRVFVSIPGHFTWTFDDPLYRILIFRGMMWSAHQPLDRLAPLATVGARVED